VKKLARSVLTGASPTGTQAAHSDPNRLSAATRSTILRLQRSFPQIHRL